MKRARAELVLAAITIIWGSTFVLVKSAIDEVSTFLFLTLRFGVAAIALAAIYAFKVRRRGIVPGIAAGCLLFTAYVFQTKGLALTTPARSAFLTGLSIPMVPLASSLVYKNRPRLVEITGILTASFGMVLMTVPSGRFEMSKGDFLSFLCAVAFALHIVVISHYSPIAGFETIALVQILTAAVLGLATFRFAEPIRFHGTPTVAAAVLVTGLLATALAFTAMAWSQKYTTATRSALIFALEPVVAFVTSYMVTGETLTGRSLIGAGIILTGVLLVELPRDGSETNGSGETSQLIEP